ncbi:DUF4194 domain-containing protein [Trichloromonas sp.]|uniref:DUF4194 domain-containing protein n=1 Tax=Trichloromonas sp. TaxID=3069249 RepID=UPI002A46117C|nr:DUF4194 domain-containing protein [Trichloromonas sp.]
MLHELEKLTGKEGGPEPDELRRAAEVLLKRQFLYADRTRDKGAYTLAVRCQEYFRNLFDALNLDFLVDVRTGFVGILPRGNALPAVLDAANTVLLLSLRVIYENALREFRVEEGGQAQIDNRQLDDFYQQHAGVPLPPLGKLKEMLSGFSRQGLVDFTTTDDREVLITVRPAIREIVSAGYLEALEDYAHGGPEEPETLTAGGDDEETE